MPHVLHQLDSYSAGLPSRTGIRRTVRRRHDPRDDQAEPRLQGVDAGTDVGARRVAWTHSVLYLNPLLAGIDPALSWEMLRLYEREVHPHLRRAGLVK